MVAGIGIVASIVGTFFVSTKEGGSRRRRSTLAPLAQRF